MKKPSIVLPTLALLVVVTLAGNSTAYAVATDFLFSWGSFGSGDGQFVQPDDLAIGPNGDVFVLESGSQRIQKFTAAGVFVTKWNSARPVYGPMRQIAIAADGGLYVLTGRNTVKYDASGAYLFNWVTGVPFSATSFRLDGDGVGGMYLTYELHGSTCTDRLQPVVTGGTVVDCDSWLYYATGEADGDVFMAGVAFDTGVPFILKKTPGGVETRWNARATNLFVDASGNVYGTDFLSHQVQIFDNNGILLTAFGSFGTGPGQFDEPYAVGVGTVDRIYIVDRDNHRVQVFGAGATPAQPSSWGRMKAQYR